VLLSNKMQDSAMDILDEIEDGPVHRPSRPANATVHGNSSQAAIVAGTESQLSAEDAELLKLLEQQEAEERAAAANAAQQVVQPTNVAPSPGQASQQQNDLEDMLVDTPEAGNVGSQANKSRVSRMALWDDDD
jgi:hypothetical protein